ncbi:MAG TPA: DUF397 domain-containing protein [Streptosporangiaceae bacterium]|nr:DUF397 domain-containing protein [Streptosporangiaceae bacterium]
MEDTADLTWRTASYSSNGGGECVEVGTADRVLIRDSKDPDGPRLGFTPRAWAAFAAKVKREG